MDDRELLHEYVANQSERAFAELVARHLPHVLATALRLVREPQMAADVAQAVFIQLGRKAWTIRRGQVLSGWLYRATRHAAFDALRGEQRRRQRETEVMKLAETDAVQPPPWEHLAPVLDEAMSQLKRGEQDVVLLRFFESKSYREVGDRLGLPEKTAAQRVNRALEKLRRYFDRRGITTTAALLGSALSANAAAPLPAGLAARVTGASFAGVSGGSLVGTFFSTLLMSTKTKILLALVIIATLAVPLAIKLQSPNALPVAANPPASPPPAPVRPPVAVHSSSAQVAAKTLPATPPSDPGVNAFTATPKADLKSAISAGIHFLDTQNTLNFFKTLMPPQALADEGKASSLEDFVAKISQDPKTEAKMNNMLEALRALEDATPGLNGEATRATYKLEPPVGGHKVVILVKVNGYWYLDGM